MRLRLKTAGLLLLIAAVVGPVSTRANRSFYINYSGEVDAKIVSLWDFSILSGSAKVDLVKLKQEGHRAYGYLSVMEVAPDASYRPELIQRKVRLLGQNAEWKSDLIDITDPVWTNYVMEVLAPALVQKGFSGFFLDTVESVELVAKQFPERAAKFRASLISLIRMLHAKFPEQKILLNRGFEIWPSVRTEIAGVMVESLFQTVDLKQRRFRAVSESDSEWLIAQIQKVKNAGLDVLVVDYCDPQKSETAFQTAAKIEALGCLAFVSTPELDGTALAPIRHIHRHVLALFGNQEVKLEDRIEWPADSGIARIVQMPLEWLGFEVDYLNATRDVLPEKLDPKIKGIILDPFMEISRAREPELARWLIQQKAAGIKIIFLGSIPFSDPAEQARVLREFGLGGTGAAVSLAQNCRITSASPRMNYESQVRVLPAKFLDLQSPAQSNVELTLSAEDQSGTRRIFEPVFTTSWGGAALHPYLFFRRPDFVSFWLVDPFYFFSKALGSEPFPIPDDSTRDGCRVFYTHIDGDGFGDRSGGRA